MAKCREIEVYKPLDLDSRLEEEKARLKEEKDTLEGYFWPEEFPILHKNDTPCFERKVKVKDKHYKLRVYVSSEYPRKMPDLVVCEPPESMPVDNPRFCGSHETHTWPPLHGFLRICHWHWAGWKIENMIFQVFNKGVEWLEAYEKYLMGKELPLDLQQMKLTEEEERAEKLQIAREGQEIALALCQSHPNYLNDLHNLHMSRIKSNILSQHNFPISHIFTLDEIRNAQSQMIETFLRTCNMDNPFDIADGWLFALLCLYTVLKLANPAGCKIDVSLTPSDDGRLDFRLVAVRPRSIKNN